MRTPSLRARGVLLAALVSFGAGCAGGQSSNPTRNPLTSATPQASITSSPLATAAISASPASAGLLGTYQATLPAVAVPSGATCIFPEGHCAPPAGAWSITISATQLASVPASGEYPAQTIVKMSDPNASSGTLEFGPSPLDCIVSTGPAGPGQYRWAEAGGTLTFTVVKDDCIDRVLVLTTVKWTKGA